AGTYTLPPLHVRINNRSYAIPFLEINVEHDLENLQPRLIMKFDNGIEVSSTEKYSTPIFTVTAGEKMYFTLYLQYAIQINQFSWNAPKDAILTELQRYEMLDASSRKEGVSQEKIPVARFEWLVLKNGTVSLPDIQISVIAYNGERSRISPLQCEVVVKEKSHESISKNESQKYFVYAFEKPFDENENEKKIVITKKDCQTLATLRSNEKHSFLPYKAKLERKEFEKSLNLANAENELNIPFVIFIFALAVVGIIFALVFFMLKRRGVSFLSFCCSLCILVVLVIAKANPFLYGGIASGGELFAVPDKTSHVISVLPVGMRVSIEEKAANWFYVKYGSMGGWVELNHIIIIR
ncbi:MAG: hypothetical protein IKI31_04075, partial [Treponema sp.]|nr:hypothetical protein [Treponema sp.]